MQSSGRNRVGGLVMRVACHRSVLILGFVILFSFSANAQTWRHVGLSGRDVQSPAAAPGSSRTLSALRSRQAGNQLVVASSEFRRFDSCFAIGAAVAVLE